MPLSRLIGGSSFQSRKTILVVTRFALAVFYVLIFSACSKQSDTRQKGDYEAQTAGPFPLTHRPERLSLIGENACKECHPAEFEEWRRSHHAQANRAVSTLRDEYAFTPAREVTDSGRVHRLEWNDGTPTLVVGDQNGSAYPLEGVIGYDPLIQYLAPFPGGKWQTTTDAFDPKENEWFEVFPGEGRRRGDWGHWTGQGMNWNANCATCHMTEYEKGLNPKTGEYQSLWTRQSISCMQCHTGLEAHVATASTENGGQLPRKLTDVKVKASCATCHSRRDELTANEFRPGDSYFDHYDLTLPVRNGLYYADGQIRDEVFVFGSFEMSRMGHAGVDCLDCHDAHSMELTRPTTNNAACTWCHDTGLDGAPLIEPLTHSHHAEGSSGNLCVECHMPKTPYMVRDPRADHGFLSPDPLLTIEMGIPNACSKCHEDQSVDWAARKVEEWYPEKVVLSRQRERARVLQSAWNHEDGIADDLISIARKEPIHAWRAAYTELLTWYSNDSKVQDFLEESLNDPSSMVRSKAAYAFGESGAAGPNFDQILDDPSLNVRIAAARSFVARGESIPDPSASVEWEEYLLYNSDRPQNALLLASEAIREGDRRNAQLWIDRAISLEPGNAELLRQVAVLQSRLGNLTEANRLLEKAYGMAPDQAQIPFSLALLRAEEGRIPETIQLLQITTRLDPSFDRAWYNLALAYLRNGEPAKARESLEKATRLRNSPEWQTASDAIDQTMLGTQEF
ncbi:MAG: cytochrome c3 family protein [Verrucomicrobiota bacterium]